MAGIINFETFVLAAIMLILTPGNDTIFILARSMGQGRRAGIVSALGISAGSLIHTLLAAFGLSILIAKSVLLFNFVKYAGAVYLFYIGYQIFADKNKLNTNVSAEKQSINYWKIFREAILTNVLNPKVALFFIAFLPQFIDPATQNPTLPFLALGLTFIGLGIVWCMVLAVFAASIFEKLRGNDRISGHFNKACGLTMIGLGIKVALAKR